HVVRARLVLLPAQAVDARLRRAQQLVHLRPVRPGRAAVRATGSGAGESAQLHPAEGAQAVPRITTSFEPLSADGRSPSTGAITWKPVSRASRRASFSQPGA